MADKLQRPDLREPAKLNRPNLAPKKGPKVLAGAHYHWPSKQWTANRRHWHCCSALKASERSNFEAKPKRLEIQI